MILGRIKLAIGGALAALVALLGAWVAILRNRAVRADLRAHKAEDAKHDRINQADIGIGASDDERIKRLRDFADRHRN